MSSIIEFSMFISNYSSAKFELVSKKVHAGAGKSTACKEYHLDIRSFNKLNAFSDEEREIYFKSKYEYKQSNKAASKMELVNEVRASYKKIGSMRTVADLFGISRQTVKSYLNNDFSPVHGSIGVKRKSILDPYIEIIDYYIEMGSTSKVIEEAIRTNGYKGSSSSIRHYIADRKKSNEKIKEKNNVKKVEYVERKKLMKLLFSKVDKVSGLTENILKKTYRREPMLEKIINLVESFRLILKIKEVNRLDDWIKKAQKLEVDEINSFINGIYRDIDAVKNAII